MALYSNSDSERPFPIKQDQATQQESYRTPWRQDYARIIHSHAFRRLQGKTQLFPGLESDFFRTRQSHSLEVAQFAKTIAIMLNEKNAFFRQKPNRIEPDILEIAGLAHDLGHPPFGHNGEMALNELMYRAGGFEGNAQTLRMLTKIEKKTKGTPRNLGIDRNGIDKRYGLNLTFRSLASILKYDEPIGLTTSRKKPKKGYYISEKDIVKKIKTKVTGQKNYRGPFKTVECQIMDIADDIAYSTYDLEDAFKANFLTPFDLIDIENELANEVTKRVTEALGRRYRVSFIKNEANNIFAAIFHLEIKNLLKALGNIDSNNSIILGKSLYRYSCNVANDGYMRTNFTSRLVKRFLSYDNFDVVENQEIPALTQVSLNRKAKIQVEILKQLSRVALINSPRLSIVAYRGKEIVREVFGALVRGKGFEFLPEDYKNLYSQVKRKNRRRIICDFIAGMTDRYCLEFYGRLKSENPQTIFKPY